MVGRLWRVWYVILIYLFRYYFGGNRELLKSFNGEEKDDMIMMYVVEVVV